MNRQTTSIRQRDREAGRKRQHASRTSSVRLGLFPPQHRHGHVRNRALALVVVLWVVTLAGLLLMSVSQTASVNYSMAHNELSSVQARWAARAGVEQAMAVLEEDHADVDSPADAWFDTPDLFENVELSTGRFSVAAQPQPGYDPTWPRFGLVDLCGRLNVNVADEKQLSALPDIKPEQVACILDWRSATGLSRPDGAGPGYYQQLRFPYQIRSGPLQTLSELRLIRGIDDLTFFGEDANLNGLLDPNEDDGNVSYPPDDANGELKAGLAGLCTVHSYERNIDAAGQPRLNITATDKKTLVDRYNFSDGLATAVLAARPRSLMDLLNVKASSAQNRPNAGDANGPDAQSSGSNQQNQPNQPPGAADPSKLNQITIGWLADHWDELTLSDEPRLPARINVNTACRDVLLTLPEMTSETADAILGRQGSSQGPFLSVGELLKSGTLSEPQFKAMAEKIAVRSSVFEIRSTGTSPDGIGCTIVAVVDRGGQTMSLLYWWASQ